MKVTAHDIKRNCPTHGEVPYTAISDEFDEDAVIVYCPRCEKEETSEEKENIIRHRP